MTKITAAINRSLRISEGDFRRWVASLWITASWRVRIGETPFSSPFEQLTGGVR